MPGPDDPIDGDLGRTPFPEVVGILDSRAASGRLSVHAEGITRVLDFAAGTLVALDGRPVGAADAASWVADVVLELCSVAAAPFRFERSEASGPAGVSADELLAGAERRVEQWRDVTRWVPSTNAVARLATQPPPGESITIDVRDWPVLSLVDGRRTVADMIVAIGGRPYDVCETLARLAIAGLVVVDYEEAGSA